MSSTEQELGAVRGNPNPQREAYWSAVSDILGHGYTLTSKDAGEIAKHYGYSPEAGAKILTSYLAKRAMAPRGVTLEGKIYHKNVIWIDDSLPLEQTDIETTKELVDIKIKERMKRVHVHSHD